jgi:uncharacterized protein YbjT (DUF2867 family)
MGTILVTGGTGTLGRPTVVRLRAAGHDVRVLSRKSGPGLVTGDLLTGKGIRQAATGADAVLHLATGLKDVALAKTLIVAAREVGIAHLVLISIVGIDQNPLGYYRGKLEIERLVTDSKLPHTILRATQFHNLLEMLFRAQRFSLVVFAPSITLQPIAVEDIADRLVELVAADPGGRVPDIGGPQRRTVPELAKVWTVARRSRRPIVPVKVPGKAFAAYAAGHSLVSGPAYGSRTFEDFLAERNEVIA